MGNRILLIDDDVDDRDLFREGLDAVAPEIEFFAAGDCKDALRLLEEKADELPDLIFLDINLPVISGWDCFSKLHEHSKWKNIPVIFYSTSSHNKDKQKAKDIGALAFFTKPHNFAELKEMLTRVTTELLHGSLERLGSH